MIFKGRNRVRYPYARYGWTRNNGKTWHGGIDIEGLDVSLGFDDVAHIVFYGVVQQSVAYEVHEVMGIHSWLIL